MVEDFEQSAVANEESQTLSVTGVLAEQLYVLSTSRIALATTFARTGEGAPVLLPLADWQVFGHAMNQEPDHDIAFEGLLPLDNIAFLLRDMSGEFRQAIENLEVLTSGTASPAQMDTTRMRDWLRQVAEQATAAIASLDRMEAGKD